MGCVALCVNDKMGTFKDPARPVGGKTCDFSDFLINVLAKLLK